MVSELKDENIEEWNIENDPFKSKCLKCKIIFESIYWPKEYDDLICNNCKGK